jgi:hypothetical protein
MKKTICLIVILLYCAPVCADIKELFSGTERSAAEAHAMITAPTMTTSNRIVVVEKPQAVVAWEAAALVEIENLMEMVTGTKSNALFRIAMIDTPQLTQAVTARIIAAQDDAQRQALILQALKVQTYWQGAQVRGYAWPLPHHFGQSAYAISESVLVKGPSLWQQRFPDSPEPTPEQIRDAIKRKKESQQ